jgi:RNA-binding protein NOB1
MASWAAIAAKATQPTVSVQDLTRSTENLRVLVVDANAIIGGVRLDGIADRAVTVQEVLEEVRDKQSRQFLASLPFTIDVAEPTDESMAAGRCDVLG